MARSENIDVKVNLTVSGATHSATRRVVSMLRAGTLPEPDRQALLDELDAVPRSDQRDTEADLRLSEIKEHGQRVDRAALERMYGRERDRAERAERERDEERAGRQRAQADRDHFHARMVRVEAGNERLRVALEPQRCGECDGVGAIPSGSAGDALWNCTRCHGTGEYPPPSLRQADADADAEPPTPEAEWQHDFMASSLDSNCALCWKPPAHELHGGADPTACDRCGGHHEPRCAADVMADAEPSRAEGVCWACHYGAEDPERWADRHTCSGQEPIDRTGLSRAFGSSRAEGDEQPTSSHVAPTCAWPCTRLAGHEGICNAYASDCHACDGDSDAEDPCLECGRGTEGGRPREADPQAPGNGDASVDGGGDDGRSRAIQAVNDALRRHGLVNAATTAIDAALAEGGVVTVEEVLHERWWGNAHFADWQRARDRVRELEEALSDLVAASRSLFSLDDTPPDLVEALSRARAALGEANR